MVFAVEYILSATARTRLTRGHCSHIVAVRHCAERYRLWANNTKTRRAFVTQRPRFPFYFLRTSFKMSVPIKNWTEKTECVVRLRVSQTNANQSDRQRFAIDQTLGNICISGRK